MKKKGFTLVEIIVCISLIVVIGLGSLFTVNFVSNKKLISKLNDITDKAINAAQVYIETNEEASNQLYKNKNGISLPLQLLVNEGLLSLDNTDLSENDIKNQYVVTFLGSTNSSENCEQITSTTSWGNDKEIYLCLNNDGTSNLSIINPSDLNNLNKVKREKYYFIGADGGSRNYVKYQDKMYQIYYVDTDDTLVLYNVTSFGNTFNGKTLSIVSYKAAQYIYGCKENNTILMSGIEYNTIKNGEIRVTSYDYFKTSYCYNTEFAEGWMLRLSTNSNEYYPSGYKIHLNEHFKITSGTGNYDNPYILEYK